MTNSKLKAVQAMQRISTVNRKPKVTREYHSTPQALAYARYVSNMQKWLSLQKFRELKADTMDWRVLDYWTYFAQSLVAETKFGALEEKAEMQEVVEHALQALTKAAESFRQSGGKFMYLLQEERDDVRRALSLCDELYQVTDDKTLARVSQHASSLIG